MGFNVDENGKRTLGANSEDTIIRNRQDVNFAILGGTNETEIIPAIAGVFQDIQALIITNTSATEVRIDFRPKSGGSVVLSVFVAAKTTLPINIIGKLKQAEAGQSWTAKLSAVVADVRITSTSQRF